MKTTNFPLRGMIITLALSFTCNFLANATVENLLNTICNTEKISNPVPPVKLAKISNPVPPVKNEKISNPVPPVKLAKISNPVPPVKVGITINSDFA
jgi:hypothetical protein